MLAVETVDNFHFQMQQKPSTFSRHKPNYIIKYKLFFPEARCGSSALHQYFF